MEGLTSGVTILDGKFRFKLGSDEGYKRKGMSIDSRIKATIKVQKHLLRPTESASFVM